MIVRKPLKIPVTGINTSNIPLKRIAEQIKINVEKNYIRVTIEVLHISRTPV